MKALIRGDRTRALGTVLGLIALIALFGGMLFMILAYRGQLVGLKHVIYSRCNQRTGYDTANHESIGADVRYYRSQLRQTLQNRPEADALILAFPKDQRPALRATEQRNISDLRDALTSKEHAYSAGVIGSCSKFK